MSHTHISNEHAPWLHRFLLKLNAIFPVFSLRVYKWGSEASLRPVVGPPLRRLIDWYGRNMEKGKVITFHEVERLVDEARSCSIGDCPCLHVYPDPSAPLREKCVRLNMAHEVAVRWDGRHHRTIAKQELLARLRQLSHTHGLHHTVVFLGGPIVYAICTCSDHCIAYQMFARYDQPHALVKGDYLSHVDESRCVGCGECTPACRFGAMEDGRVDADRCYGCGLCATRCRHGAVSMRLRHHVELPLPEAAG